MQKFQSNSLSQKKKFFLKFEKNKNAKKNLFGQKFQNFNFPKKIKFSHLVINLKNVKKCPWILIFGKIFTFLIIPDRLGYP